LVTTRAATAVSRSGSSIRPSRRQFLAGASGLALIAGSGTLQAPAPAAAAPRPVAQRGMPVIGYLAGPSPNRPASRVWDYVQAFKDGLSDYGWEIDRDVRIEYRWADGDYDRLPSLAADLVRMRVDVILIADARAILSVRAATQNTPIPAVMAISGDPISGGHVDSYRRPGRNITGMTDYSIGLNWSRVELLTRMLPSASRVLLLQDASRTAGGRRDFEEIKEAADALAVELVPAELRSTRDLESAFATGARQRVNALLLQPDPPLSLMQRGITSFATQRRLPAVYPHRGFVEFAHGLAARGPDRLAMFRRAASYVFRILNGASPATLPMEGPTAFDLALDLSVARHLVSAGLAIPPSVVQQATFVAP
jgi:putative ABC transport system substrate-binding protein